MKRAAVLTATLAACFASLAGHAAPVAYVAADGRDQPPRCTQATPCRTFQAAHDAVDSGGEVVALDAADFGPVTVRKSVSIVGVAGSSAAINVASGNGISIATPKIDVVVRNLRITGNGGAVGIAMSAGHSLTVEDSVVSGFGSDGIRIEGVAAASIANTVSRGNGGHGASVAATRVNVVGSRFMANAGSGLWLATTDSSGTNAMVTDSVASSNGDRGFSARADRNSTMVSFARDVAAHNGGAGFANEWANGFAVALMTIGSSVSSHNTIGLFTSTSITPGMCHLQSLGNNQVAENVQDVQGPLIALAPR
jgi:hypothetical protein